MVQMKDLYFCLGIIAKKIIEIVELRNSMAGFLIVCIILL